MKPRTNNLIILYFFLLLSIPFLIPKVDGQNLNAGQELQNTFIHVAKTLKHSVVNIRVEKMEEAANYHNFHNFNDEEDNPFGDLFKFFQVPRGKKFKIPRNSFKSQGAGSGVVFSEKGYIVTNNHVIKDATKITVKFVTGKEYEAKVIGQDPQSDLAVVQVSAKEALTPANFADSSKLQPGQWCIAIGNPFGLEQSVTVGVVSALGRSGLGAAAFEDFIQTDAGINPGNSGGPLVDLEGKVIGINTLIFAAPGSGIGFAIPSNMVKKAATQIIDHGAVERPFIGISMREVTQELAEHFALPDRYGAVVIDMQPGTPAQKAGLQQMDIIREIDGNEMQTTSEVQKYVFSRKVGDKVSVLILRNGKEKTVTITLEKMPGTYGLRNTDEVDGVPQPKEKNDEEKNWGFSYKPLTPEIAKSLNIDSKKQGLVITDVREGSAAEKGGLKENDILVQANGKPVTSDSELNEALSNPPDGKKSSVVVVQRGTVPLFLVLPDPQGN